MNETGLSERDGRVVREDGQGIIRAGCGERDDSRVQNYTGGIFLLRLMRVITKAQAREMARSVSSWL